jgi:GTP pyrophosphokinase
MHTIEDIIKVVKRNNKKEKVNVDIKPLIRAWEFASVAHQNQKRLSGEEYIIHPVETAYILAKMDIDTDTVIAGLLHDIPEETEFSVSDIKEEFGSEIAQLVDGVTKIGKIKYRGVKRYAENLRKMFIAMSKDIRVIIIRFADRIHNLETLHHHPNKEKQYRIALESLEIYAPIAGRLGMYKFKEKIEDLSFPYVYPDEYSWTSKKIKNQISLRTKSLDKIKKSLENLFNKNNIEYLNIYGRKKHTYSTYKKLLRKDKDIYNIYDLIALRIIAKTINDCYSILGIIHNNWQPLNGRVKDYISQPKPNGYQSLHTTIFDENHKPIEIQIRTQRMERIAEFGIAAHWRYKENRKVSINKKDFGWISDLIKWQKKIKDNKSYLKNIKLNTDIFKSRIFVFTPKNDVIDLPENSTAIDFAYHIHTEIGHKCVGVKINDKMSKVDTELKNGDFIKILTDKNRKLPNPDWLNFVRTNTAKDKIKTALLHSENKKISSFKNDMVKKFNKYVKNKKK